jgi:hypothetical protein
MGYPEGLQAIDEGFDKIINTGQPSMSGKLRGRKSH